MCGLGWLFLLWLLSFGVLMVFGLAVLEFDYWFRMVRFVGCC